jgi:hypothetical protein
MSSYFAFYDLLGKVGGWAARFHCPPAQSGSHQYNFSSASAALADAFLRAIVLLLNLAVEICRSRSLWNARARDSLAVGAKWPLFKGCPDALPDGGGGRASIPAALFGMGRKSHAHSDNEHDERR